MPTFVNVRAAIKCPRSMTSDILFVENYFVTVVTRYIEKERELRDLDSPPRPHL